MKARRKIFRTCLNWEVVPTPKWPGDCPRHRGNVLLLAGGWGSEVPLTQVFFPYSGILVHHR